VNVTLTGQARYERLADGWMSRHAWYSSGMQTLIKMKQTPVCHQLSYLSSLAALGRAGFLRPLAGAEAPWTVDGTPLMEITVPLAAGLKAPSWFR
jgi:hypothetical protein